MRGEYAYEIDEKVRQGLTGLGFKQSGSRGLNIIFVSNANPALIVEMSRGKREHSVLSFGVLDVFERVGSLHSTSRRRLGESVSVLDFVDNPSLLEPYIR